jgi:hypothetical protein
MAEEYTWSELKDREKIKTEKRNQEFPVRREGKKNNMRKSVIDRLKNLIPDYEIIYEDYIKMKDLPFEERRLIIRGEHYFIHMRCDSFNHLSLFDMNKCLNEFKKSLIQLENKEIEPHKVDRMIRNWKNYAWEKWSPFSNIDSQYHSAWEEIREKD